MLVSQKRDVKIAWYYVCTEESAVTAVQGKEHSPLYQNTKDNKYILLPSVPNEWKEQP